MPTLLVLAAGLGSRYGGLKQIDPVGPSGETLLDYAVFDALRAGFDRVAFIIRQEFADAFRTQVIAKYAGRVRTDLVFQAVDALPPGIAAPASRTKPWGTGHAVWCAHQAISDPFAVINADDFYGADALQKLAAFFREQVAHPDPLARFAMAGYRLAATLSEHGAVARGVCTAEHGRLRSIVERMDITPASVGPGRSYSGAEIVSMNCWAFTPALFPLLDARLRGFLADHREDAKAEFYLPSAVSAMIAAGDVEVAVLPTTGPWFGVTYREDRPRVAAAIAGLVAHGVYPPKLFA
jgi:UTP-glucose-1-phosphate uridylyltransferase